jgi:hypothetical protein
MLYPVLTHQIIPVAADASPASGLRKRVSTTARTVEMEAPRSVPSSQVRRVQMERLVPLSCRSANDVEASAVLINAGDPRATRYCYVAPRSSAR